MFDTTVLIGYIIKQYILFELQDKRKQNANENNSSNIIEKANRFRQQLFKDKKIISQLLFNLYCN